mgnify:FL=1
MAAAPLIVTDPAEMRAWSRARRAEGKRVGFVPTMVRGGGGWLLWGGGRDRGDVGRVREAQPGRPGGGRGPRRPAPTPTSFFLAPRGACTPATWPWWQGRGVWEMGECGARSAGRRRAKRAHGRQPRPHSPPSSRQLADVVVVSIYVNPTQFAAHEDFGVYPRDRAADRAALAAASVDACFEPATLYGGGDGDDSAHVIGAAGGGAAPPAAWVTVEALSTPLCGASRPHFFRGVATVVAKLFNIVDPDVAIFGRKDAQQLAVVRAFTRALHFGVHIEGAPIVREADGLAMSSRNALLAAGDRQAAPAIRAALVAAVAAIAAAGAAGAPAAPLIDAITASIAASGGRVDYVAAVDTGTLAPVDTATTGPAARPTLIAVAAHYGAVRLIDNVVVGGADEG